MIIGANGDDFSTGFHQVNTKLSALRAAALAVPVAGWCLYINRMSGALPPPRRQNSAIFDRPTAVFVDTKPSG
jgi:hypothetical protein